jgi:hypothetical protein
MREVSYPERNGGIFATIVPVLAFFLLLLGLPSSSALTVAKPPRPVAFLAHRKRKTKTTTMILPKNRFTSVDPTGLLATAAIDHGNDSDKGVDPSLASSCTDKLTSGSGLPVCRYALGGAARSTQPTGLVYDYCERVARYCDCDDGNNNNDDDNIVSKTPRMAPFLFYYNPHRYADFMRGVRELASESGKTTNSNNHQYHRWKREDLFLASGGTDRSPEGMEERLSDALQHSGGEYLDMFVLEYVCPDEPREEIQSALATALEWIRAGKVRYVAASTHSHKVGAWLGSLRRKKNESGDNNKPFLDAMMLRYNMAHKIAAEEISFPVCAEAGIPVLAFTTTRWNRLQAGHHSAAATAAMPPPPETPDCLSFALVPSSPSWTSPPKPKSMAWPVEIVLHSARDTEELGEAMACLSPKDVDVSRRWRDYGDLDWNDLDGFDEYPEEQKQQ